MSSSGNSIGEQIKSGVKGVHGIGEAIRGTALAETDKTFGTQSTETTKNEKIAQKGVTNMKAADQIVGHNHGIKGTSTATTVGTADTTPATSAGAHATAPGNIGSTGSTVGHGVAGVQEQPGVNQRF